MEQDDEGRITRKRGILKTITIHFDRRRIGELLVVNGLVTPSQLRFALGLQKETDQPLGQIFLKHSIISPRELALTLGRQHLLRCIATFVVFFASLTHCGNKKAHADMIKDVPAQISIAVPASTQNYAHMVSFPALFETHEKRSGNLSPFTKWTGMFSRFDQELKTNSGSQAIQEWQSHLEAFQNLPLKAMAAQVNTLVNEKEYILDKNNWGKSDYWSTPVEFLKYGGDCEDFAIAKYTALRMLGVPEERLRVAIVHDNKKNIPHAVLIVYTEQGVYILDNQIKTLVSAETKGRYRPIFSINRQAWWLHTNASTTIIASAQ